MPRLAALIALLGAMAACSRPQPVGDAPRPVASEIASARPSSPPPIVVHWEDRDAEVRLDAPPVRSTTFGRARRAGRVVATNAIVVETASGVVVQLTDGGYLGPPVLSADGTRVAYARAIRGADNPCELADPVDCTEILEIASGREPTKVVFPVEPGEPSPITGLEPARYSGDGGRLYYYTRGGFVGNACLLARDLVNKKITLIACGAAVLLRELPSGALIGV